MPLSREDAVAEIKRRLDIVEFIGQYLPLKKAGINQSGRCPFHDEKTPSFMVSPERQTFKCFGCGKGGDIITFAMEKEGLSFPEAIEMLAARAGVELPKPERPAPGTTPTTGKNQLIELNETCRQFWHEILIKHPKAAEARQYLVDRGMTAELIKDFGVGFAPPAPTTRDLLRRKGFTESQERLAGEPARFSGRIIFPIADVIGRTIGFTGRQLPAPAGVEQSGPKYWNTPETPLFHKSDALYALHLAKDEIRKQSAAIIAEGQMDVIGLHAAGLRNTIASSGTALTDRQCHLLSRFADELVFCYDADEAGLKAAERGFEVALAADLNPTVMSLPEGKDPGDLGFSKPDQLTRAYEQRQPVIAWLLARAVAEHGTAQPVAKKRVVRRLAPWLKRIRDAVERRGWLDMIAERLETTSGVIEEALRAWQSPRVTRSEPKKEAAPPAITETDLLVGLLVAHPSLLTDLSLDHLRGALPADWHPILDWLAAPADQRPELAREDQLRLDGAALIAEQHYELKTPEERRVEFKQLLTRATQHASAVIRQRLNDQIKAAQEAGDETAVERLLKELQSVNVNRQ